MNDIQRLEVPSGRVYSSEDLDCLAIMNLHGFIEHRDKPFTLKSGVQSRIYVQGRNDLTDNPDLSWLVGRKTARLVVANQTETEPAPCLIGIPTAGNAIASAGSLVAYREQITTPQGDIGYRVMREIEKQHGSGANQWVNGSYDSNRTFWAVDNVVTDCGTKIEAAQKLTESGYPALEMPWLVFVDRQQGGIEKMRAHGFQRIVVAFYLLDITYAMGELGLWPKSLVSQVEAEIKAHQFT